MKYQVGDKVLLLHSDEEGIVRDIISDKMVMVDVKGVVFPVYCDQIDFPYFKMFTSGKSQVKKKIQPEEIRREKPAPRKATNEGVFISFFPVFNKDVFDDDQVEKLKVYLVNQNSEEYNFSYSLLYPEGPGFSLKNNIFPASDFYLHDVLFEDMSDNPRFQFDFSLPQSDKKRVAHFEASLKLKAKQLFKSIEEMQLRNEASFSFPLFREYPAKPEEEKLDLSALYNRGFYDASRAASHLPPPQSVIDLHIEKITDNRRGMNNAQILETQLAYFDKYYDSARANRMPNLTVIHGIGEGVLRNEIHERLRQRPGVKSFVNQFHPLYGFGATEIYFSY